MAGPVRRIVLITDSTSDLLQEHVDQYDIRIAPMYLLFGTEQYRDRFEISQEQFYERLAVGDVHPHSSQPVVADFLRIIEEAQAEGAEAVVIITMSSQLSGAIQSARQSVEQSPIPVYCHDSRSGGMGLGWQVLAAARAREAGADAEGMVAAADRARRSLQIIWYVDSLEYLHRGGRIGGASRLIGSALHLKPVLYVDRDTGRVEALERVRTAGRALERVYHLFFERMKLDRPLHIAAIHSNVEAAARSLAERVRAEFKPVEMLVTGISPVMGTHIGPGAVGLAGYYE